MRYLLLLFLLIPDTSPRSKGAVHHESAGLIRSLFASSANPMRVAVNGRILAVGASDGIVHLFDYGTWKNHRQLRGHTSTVAGLTFDRRGRLYSASYDGTIRCWDTTKGQEVWSRRANGAGNRLTVSPNGTLMVGSGVRNTVVLWETKTGKERHEMDGHRQIPQAFAWSANGGKLVSAASDGQVLLWNPSTGEREERFSFPGKSFHSVAMSGDGRRVHAGTADGQIISWDVATGRRTITRAHTAVEGRLAYTKNGRYLLSASADSAVRMWDARTLKPAAELKHHTVGVNDLAVSGDGRIIVTCGGDRHVKIWSNRPGGMRNVRPKGFLGVYVQSDADSGGVKVTGIIADTAAERDGVQENDILWTVNGRRVTTTGESGPLISSYFSGESVVVEFIRDGEKFKQTIRLGIRPPE